MESTYGDATVELVQALADEGVEHIAVLIRHSAREFNQNVHDLVNPLTDEGRDLSKRLGAALPKTHTLRGYASPPDRCMETAQLALLGHAERGGQATRVRPIEGLGVFYVLDQMKMYRVMRESNGLAQFVDRWVAGDVPRDSVIPAELAAKLVVGIVADKLDQGIADRQIDLCVSHDLTLHVVWDQLLGHGALDHEVEFLDGLAIFRRGGALYAKSRHGPVRDVTAFL